MNSQQLFEQIQKKRSFLCVGLDSDITLIPAHLLADEDPVFSFNKAIVDATHKFCVAYKPNLAFYESNGIEGLISLGKTAHYIRENYPEIFLIADAKRGDIGNTSAMYAKSVFEKDIYDAVTVAPYMGEDSVTPFYAYQGKWVIILALTSNKGAYDFQLTKDADSGQLLYQKVIQTSSQWGTPENTMYVVGATKAEMLADIRIMIPEHFLLVPGVGAQGGSLADVARYGLNSRCGLLVNSSRQIIYASKDANFDILAQEAANMVQREMQTLLEDRRLV